MLGKTISGRKFLRKVFCGRTEIHGHLVELGEVDETASGRYQGSNLSSPFGAFYHIWHTVRQLWRPLSLRIFRLNMILVRPTSESKVLDDSQVRID
jgi:hypothetical protein